MSYTTTPSSATVIEFNPPPAAKPKAGPTFAQAREAWLRPLLADSRLADGEVRVCSAIYFGFNQKHYEKTGHLLSWPGWLKLGGETTKCERTIARTFNKLERLGVLQILRGGFDPKTRQRRANKYVAKFAHLTLESGGPPDSSDEIHLTEPPDSRVRRLGEGLGERDKKEEKQILNSRGPAAPEGRKQATRPLPSNSPLPSSEQARRWRAEGKSEFTGIPKKTPLNGRRPS
jgi:hypothetical protein